MRLLDRQGIRVIPLFSPLQNFSILKETDRIVNETMTVYEKGRTS